jgi:very-long-chain enoyl-CoA reductase
MLIHPLFYYLRPYIYKNVTGPPSQLQTISMWLIVLHFLKREFETLFVHRFGTATMPATNIFKNSAHYWFLSGFNLAYWIYAPTAPTAGKSNSLITGAGIALYIYGELSNLSTHITLRNLRPAGSSVRVIPKGYGFGLVTCPNYLFEIVAWVAIWIVTWSSSTGLFILIAGGQMALWATKKEKRLRKDFGDKYHKKRYAMIPGVW